MQTREFFVFRSSFLAHYGGSRDRLLLREPGIVKTTNLSSRCLARYSVSCVCFFHCLRNCSFHQACCTFKLSYLKHLYRTFTQHLQRFKKHRLSVSANHEAIVHQGAIPFCHDSRHRTPFPRRRQPSFACHPYAHNRSFHSVHASFLWKTMLAIRPMFTQATFRCDM